MRQSSKESKTRPQPKGQQPPAPPSRSQPAAAAEHRAGPVHQGSSAVNLFDDGSEDAPRPQPKPVHRGSSAVNVFDDGADDAARPKSKPVHRGSSAVNLFDDVSEGAPKPMPVHRGSSAINQIDNVPKDAAWPKPKPKRKDPRFIPPSDSDEPLESYGDHDLDDMGGRQPDVYPVEELGIADISATMSLVAIQEHADNHSSQVGDPRIVTRLTNAISRVVELMNQMILTLEGSSRTEARRL